MRPSGEAPSQSSASSGDNTRNSMCETSAPVRRLYASTASSSRPVPHSVASLPAKGSDKPSFSSHSSARPPRQNPSALPNADAVRREARSACHASPPCSSSANEPTKPELPFGRCASEASARLPSSTRPPTPTSDRRSKRLVSSFRVGKSFPWCATWRTSARCLESCLSALSQVFESCMPLLPPVHRPRSREESRAELLPGGETFAFSN
mmetsp:Transcript_5351/g.21631  ORF Transcript_5351/g.21631 Transcript_5351/m.21631 type:complete len:209 (+) Transcript_5351:572-1198(+)